MNYKNNGNTVDNMMEILYIIRAVEIPVKYHCVNRRDDAPDTQSPLR